MPVIYLDASALVKLIRREAETDALSAYVAGADLVSSELVLTEIPRAVRRVSAREPEPQLGPMLERAGEVLDAVAFRPLDRPLLEGAGAIAEPALRALDAIHVASAADLSPLSAFVTYDERQAAAARLAGLRTMSPGV
jgi:predicted nucleic acid-binding protein